MRIDELERGLSSARDAQMPADPLTGRQRVDRHVRRQRFERVGIAALIIVLLAGAGVFLATRGTDEQRVISGPGAVPQYLPDPMPPGPVMLQEYPAGPGEGSDTGEVVIWTDDAAQVPSASSNLIRLSVLRYGTNKPGAMAPTVVDRERGTYIGWVDQTGNAYSLESVGGLRGELEQLQRATEVDSAGRLGTATPSGYREVLRRTYTFPFSYPPAPDALFTPPDSVGFVASFDEARYPRTSFSAFVAPQSDVWLLAATFPIEPIELRGRRGHLVRRTAEQASGSSTDGSMASTTTIEISVAVVWWETDDVMLSVAAPTEGEAVALAQSMRLVDDVTWEAFVASGTSYPTSQVASPATRSSVGSSTETAVIPSTITVP